MGQISKLAVLGLITIGLSGCAELGFSSKKVKNTDQALYNADDTLLRGTPEHGFVFDGSKDYDIEIYDTALTSSKITRGNVHYYYSDHYYAMERELQAQGGYSAQNYDVQIYDTALVQPTNYAYQSYTTTTSTTEAPNISFEKTYGESDMNDWLSCEALAGRYVVWDKNSYKIEPKFETCMRGKGYVLESDVASM